jgi:hypothetical protein
MLIEKGLSAGFVGVGTRDEVKCDNGYLPVTVASAGSDVALAVPAEG